MKELKGFFILMLCFYLGDIIQKSLHIIAPGAVIGMAILLVLLLIKVVKLSDVEVSANFVVANMMLTFIPGGVKLIAVKNELFSNIVPILVILIVATLVTMLVTGYVVQILIKAGRKNERHTF